ncbi:MAG: septum formation initiator family protein [Actinomycetota bacterium]|nr:septum formation initiator family protein [Actinomycetota bacterium]
MKGRAGLLFAALALAGVLVLAFLPARAYLDQRHQHQALIAQVDRLGTENQALEDRTAQLGTDAEIERLARGYNMVKPGEEVYFLPPQAGPPATAPAATATAHRSKSLWHRLTSIL